MKARSGFTLVEILIVVIILGILAAIVIPQFTNASTQARENSLKSNLQTMRSQIELYKVQHSDSPPSLTGFATQMTGKTDIGGTVSATGAYGPYLQQIPVNPINDMNGVDAAAGDDIGWVYDAATGAIHSSDAAHATW